MPSDALPVPHVCSAGGARSRPPGTGPGPGSALAPALREWSGERAPAPSGTVLPAKMGRSPQRGGASPGRQSGAGWGRKRGWVWEGVGGGKRDGGCGFPSHLADLSRNELDFSVTSKSYKRGWIWEQMPSLFTSLLKL